MRVWNEAKELLEGAEGRSFSAEEDKKYDALMGEVDRLDEQLKTYLESEQRSRDADETYNAMAGRTAERQSGGSAYLEEVRSWAAGRGGRHMDIQRQVAGPPNLRTLQSIANTGSATVPTDFYDQLISYLIEVSGILQTGPSVLKTSGGETLQIPTVASHLTATTAAQAGNIVSAEPTFAQKTLGAQKFGALITVARELIDDTAVDLLGYLAMSAGRAIGNAFGSALVNGGNGITGGLVPSASIGVTGGLSAGTGASSISGAYGSAIVGAPVYNDLVDMEYSVIAPYRQSRSCYWLAADKTIGTLRKLKDVNGRPVWEPSAVLGAPDLLLGKPLVVDPFMPALGAGLKALAFGDFSQYFVRLVGGLRFERSDDFNFGSDVVTFRALLRGDGNLADTNAIRLFQGGAS